MSNDPILAVVVALVPDAQGRLLWTFNAKWGAFALPMTKQRRGRRGAEPFERAALRAAAEALGVPVRLVPGAPAQSLLLRAFSERRQQEWQYNYYLYLTEPHPDWAWRLQPRAAHLWLTVAQALEDGLEPLANSSRLVLRRARAGLSRLPNLAVRRQSSAGLALIRREAEGLWLAQWNKRWGAYNFVGGHRRARDASFRDCVAREVEEELGLRREADFRVAAEPATHLEYTAWSEGAQAETDYTMELFAVELRTPEARRRVDADPANRWLCAAEVRDRRAADGKPVSATMQGLLDRMAAQGG